MSNTIKIDSTISNLTSLIRLIPTVQEKSIIEKKIEVVSIDSNHETILDEILSVLNQIRILDVLYRIKKSLSIDEENEKQEFEIKLYDLVNSLPDVHLSKDTIKFWPLKILTVEIEILKRNLEDGSVIDACKKNISGFLDLMIERKKQLIREKEEELELLLSEQDINFQKISKTQLECNKHLDKLLEKKQEVKTVTYQILNFKKEYQSFFSDYNKPFNEKENKKKQAISDSIDMFLHNLNSIKKLKDLYETKYINNKNQLALLIKNDDKICMDIFNLSAELHSVNVEKELYASKDPQIIDDAIELFQKITIGYDKFYCKIQNALQNINSQINEIDVQLKYEHISKQSVSLLDILTNRQYLKNVLKSKSEETKNLLINVNDNSSDLKYFIDILIRRSRELKLCKKDTSKDAGSKKENIHFCQELKRSKSMNSLMGCDLSESPWNKESKLSKESESKKYSGFSHALKRSKKIYSSLSDPSTSGESSFK